MENLSETLRCLLSIRLALECGDSVRTALNRHFVLRTTPFTKTLKEWLFYFDQKKDFAKLITQLGPYERHFIEILEAGLLGHRIYDRILIFETELIEKCRYEIEKEIDQLPYKMMIPLFLFQFPAYLILILGPLLNQFLKSLN